MPSSANQRWRPRAALSTTLRALAGLIPLAGGVATSIVGSRIVPKPSGLWSQVLWFAAIVGLSTAVLLVLERATRKLLPLTVLLKLSLLFPDTAPSRFSIALRTGNTKRLAKWAADVRRNGTPDDVHQAAETVVTLAAALNAHDRATRGHSERVRAFTDLLGEELKLKEPERDRLRWAGLLHDIGKLSVAVDILNKPGKPEPDEWEALQRHPAEGARIAAPLLGWLGEWGDAIAQHHERFDGAGYPAGLAGYQICLGGRIVAVADCYDTMTSVRSYKRPFSVRKARTELATGAGSQFDPQVVRAFLNISLGRLRWIVGPMGWLAEIPILGLAPRAALASLAGSAAVQAGLVAVAVSAGAVVGGASHSGEHDPGRAHASTTQAPSAQSSGPSSTTSPALSSAATPSTTTPSTTVPDQSPDTSLVPHLGGVTVPLPVPPIDSLIPGVTVPTVSVPTLPPVPLPTVPPVTVPPVPLPTVPPVTVPPVTVPPVPLPTVPPVTVPPVTLPAVTLPPVTVPPVTLPPVPDPTIPKI